MKRYIDKAAVVAEIERRRDLHYKYYMKNGAGSIAECKYDEDRDILSFIDTLEVKDPYEQRLQHDSVKAGIQDYAETYSFNIESQLFPQLTKEQQTLWRKEIEQACISGGEMGIELARDIRYKENVEVKEVDLKKQVDKYSSQCLKKLQEMGDDDNDLSFLSLDNCAKYFFELGLKAQKGE